MYGSETSTVSILVVEDDPGIAALLLYLLNAVDGWGATVACNASAARSTFQQVPIDVLVMDVGLPGISGLELLELLREDDGWHDQPVVIFSGQAQQSEVQEAVRAGWVTEALTKPKDINRLIRVIEEAVAS
jgi:CheY-like chemotaxis protein